MHLSSFFQRLFRALQYRNYRLFFYGQAVSLIGTWMQQITVIWLIYRLTSSPIMVGLAGFFSQVPTFFLAPFGGVVADRVRKKDAQIILQVLFLLLAFVFGSLVYFNIHSVVAYLALSFGLGVLNAFDMPIRQAYFIDLIDNKKDIANAVALNSVCFHGARLIGPSIAGILIKFFGEGICFFLNSASYIPVIWVLFLIDRVGKANPQNQGSFGHNLREGIAYLRQHKPIISLLQMVGIISFMGMAYTILLPLFVREIFHGDSALLGIFMSTAGVGALIGAIYIASRENITHLPTLMVLAGLSLGTCLIIFAYSQNLWIALPLLVIIGFSMMLLMGSSNVIIQTIVAHHFRGRIFSIYTMAFAGTVPFGNLFAGYLSKQIGFTHTQAICGVCCILGSIYFSSQAPHIREKVRLSYLTAT